MKLSKTVFGSGGSLIVDKCQICNFKKLIPIIFLGYLPPVNTLPLIGTRPKEQPSYPAELLYCSNCHLVQLGLIVDPNILFPKEYPYTSSTTKVLRDNFTELYKESSSLIKIEKDDLVIDIGSNDGNLLSNFQSKHKVLGITPEDIGKLAIEKGIPTILKYFTKEIAKEVIQKWGKAKVVTATNVFAHIENPNEVLKNIINLLDKDGVFISESHYLYSLLQTLQYDTIYHEHLRYYSLHSLKYLLESQGLEVFHAKEIPPHGGSIRVYAARKGIYPIHKSVEEILKKEKKDVTSLKEFAKFKERVVLSKLKLHKLLSKLKENNKRSFSTNKKIYGISAPSRATTLINYVGLDGGIIDCVLEIKGSYKIGKYIPGTLIPILDEEKLFKDQPDYAILFSWHIAKELIPKLKRKGFKGDFIIPLSNPRVIRNSSKD